MFRAAIRFAKLLSMLTMMVHCDGGGRDSKISFTVRFDLLIGK